MKLIIRWYSISVLAAVLVSACTSKTNQTKDEGFSPEMIRFEPYPGNPVFSGTGTDTWDQKIRERGFILYEDGLYKMWYTGYNSELARQKFLGYATSTDGIHWKRYSDRPVFSQKWTEDMFVFRHEGIYHMYAEGEGDVAHLLTSPDGIRWEEQGDLTILSSTGDTIPAPFGTPVVWVEDGRWLLFYERNDLGIWLAESNDKLTWINIQDEPVLTLGPDPYDIAAIAADHVVKYKGRYYLYYHATDRMDWQDASSHVTWTSNVAVSSDLIRWTKYPGNPIIEGDHSSPVLAFDGEKPSLYTMHPEVYRFTQK